MERFEVNMERVEELRDWARGNYPSGATILQGSVLKQDDQILWLGMAPCHVLWGAGVDTFCVYSPDCFGDLLAEVPCGWQAEYISDRAPVNPEEPPLPIFPEGQPPPEQMQQADADESERQMGDEKQRHKATLQEQRQAVAQVLAQLTDEQRAQAAAKIREKRPELVAQEHPDLGDHRHAVPPPAGGPKGDRD